MTDVTKPRTEYDYIERLKEIGRRIKNADETLEKARAEAMPLLLMAKDFGISEQRLGQMLNRGRLTIRDWKEKAAAQLAENVNGDWRAAYPEARTPAEALQMAQAERHEQESISEEEARRLVSEKFRAEQGGR